MDPGSAGRDPPSSKDRTAFQPPHRGQSILPNTPFFAQLLRNARAGHLAVRDDNSAVEKTYAQLLADILTLRAALLKGLPNDVVEQLDRREEVYIGILAPGGYEYVVAVGAVYAIGAALVPMTVALPVEEAAYFVSKSRQVAMVTSSSAIELGSDTAKFVNERDGTRIKVFDVSKNLAGSYPHPDNLYISSDRQLDENGPGMVIFTSGTTGPPKGGVLRRNFFSEETRSIAEHYAVTPKDVILHVLPVHHATGAMINTLPMLMAAACIEYRSGSFDAEWTWNRWRKGGLTIFSGVPTIYTRLMRYYQQHIATLPAKQRETFDQAAKNIRIMMCGTSALPKPLQEAWTQLRGGKPILTRYGSTEVGAIFKAPLDPQDVPDGSVGEAAPGVEVKLTEGDEGELLVKSPWMISKYIFDDAATAAAFDKQGYFKTGDICRRDGKYYTIVGRANQDIIKSGGYKISALDIEREALSLDYVNEAMVVGVDDDEFGQRVGAVISLRDDQKQYSVKGGAGTRRLTIDDFRNDLRHRLASYKMPTLLRVFEGDLPKTASGKVMKKVLGPQLLPSPGWQSVPEVQAWFKGAKSKL